VRLVSAQRQATGGGFTWTEQELARAKALRREGYTHGTIAGMLRTEFGSDRTGMALQRLFCALRRDGLVVETVEDHDRQDVRRRALVREQQAELKAANSLRRSCLRCRGEFDSHGAGNRICEDCKRHGVFSS
jgi:hypothetical protein